MVVQPLPGKEKREAPYATPRHVLGILSRYRERGLPPILGVESVEDALGISKVYAYRTLDALQFLGFLDGANHPEPIFHKLRELTDEGYKSMLVEQIRHAYPLLFENLDPTKDDEQQIRDHFRRYDPPSQTQRQFQFFRALCAAAGLIEGKAGTTAARTSRPKSQQGRTHRVPVNRRQTKEEPPAPPPSDDDVRRLLAETLVEKIREVDAGDRETVNWYLEQIAKLAQPFHKTET